jgi:hypothetical protein
MYNYPLYRDGCSALEFKRTHLTAAAVLGHPSLINLKEESATRVVWPNARQPGFTAFI